MFWRRGQRSRDLRLPLVELQAHWNFDPQAGDPSVAALVEKKARYISVVKTMEFALSSCRLRYMIAKLDVGSSHGGSCAVSNRGTRCCEMRTLLDVIRQERRLSPEFHDLMTLRNQGHVEKTTTAGHGVASLICRQVGRAGK